jgi:hypothetical protein
MMRQGIKKLWEILTGIAKSPRQKLRHSIEIGGDDFPAMYSREFRVVRSIHESTPTTPNFNLVY